ncbi:MAG: GH1 family beta-glucosidase [Micavibrio sp.]
MSKNRVEQPLSSVSFPQDFIWGTATAAYQIEGAVAEDGRGPSIWDVFSHTPGKIRNDENGDIACDHYHRLDEDLDLIAGVVPHYRFSISWTRILPDGTGAVNPQGVAFYNRLIDGLIARGVTPWITMYHWDLPQALQEKGGWANRDIIGWFDFYAATLHRLFGDRVKNWIILNEPSVHSWLGHGLGFHAPGVADEKTYLSSAHHMNLVIGHTYRLLKSIDPSLNVGSSYTLLPVRKGTSETPDSVVAVMDSFWNRNFFDPLVLGRYPQIMAGHFAPFIQDGDMDLCRTRLDFVGVQHYNPIEAAEDSSRIFETFFGPKNPDRPQTDYGWAIDPDGFHECLVDFSTRYGADIPVIVTENGAAFFDTAEEGRSADPRRIAFLNDYITAMHRAMRDGVNIKGYFVWSFLDNFEWADGYIYRFGLVHIDYANGQKRTPKDSYYWYRDMVRQNALPEGAKEAA